MPPNSFLSGLPDKVTVIEVGPRDGLQNECKPLDVEVKAKFIEMLSAAGLEHIEVTSFVHAEKIPQMKDAPELYERVALLPVNMPCLVPNLKGLETALAKGVKTIAVFTATSEEFNKKNINATIEESFVNISSIAKIAAHEGIKVRGYISTVFGCPYQGETSIEKAAELSKRLFDLGCYQVSLGDTIGAAGPSQVKAALESFSDLDFAKLALHFHDTKGQALANILVALEMGITNFDSSAGGLGGCPYADPSGSGRVSGNVATEDVVSMLESLDIECGVDFSKLVQASNFILDELELVSRSKALCAYNGGSSESNKG